MNIPTAPSLPQPQPNPPQRDEDTPTPTPTTTPPLPPQRPRGSISSFLFFSFILFMMTNNNTEDPSTRNQYVEALQSFEWQMGNYSAWVNGTDPDMLNFTMPVKPAAEDGLVESFLKPQSWPGQVLDPLITSYFPNITGFIRGSSTPLNISPSALSSDASYEESPGSGSPPGSSSGSSYAESESWYPFARDLMSTSNETLIQESLGDWNWTKEGKVALSVTDARVEIEGNGTDVALLHGRIEFTDADKDDQLRLEFEGVHFIANGSIYGFAEPAGSNIDIRELPSLVPSAHQNSTARLILPELSARISKLRTLISSGTIDSSSPSSSSPSSPSCNFSLYAQLLPTSLSLLEMSELEEELLKPTGASVRRRPEMRMRGVLVSRRCGVVVRVGEKEGTEGLRTVEFFGRITSYAGFAACIYLFLLLLLSRQMALSRTPAALARISRWSFFAQALADSISFASHITFAILAEGRPSLSLVAPAFLACILFANEVQFGMLIYSVQAPEDAVGRTAPPAPAPTPTPASLPASTTTPTTTGDANATTTPIPTITINSPSPTSEAHMNSDINDVDSSFASTPPPPELSRQTETSTPPAPTVPPVTAPTTTTTTTTQATPPPRRPQPSILRLAWSIIRHDSQTRTWLLTFLLITLTVRLLLAPSLGLLFFAALYSSFWIPQIVRAARRGRGCGLGGWYLVGTTVGRGGLAGYYLIYPKNVLDVTPRSWMLPLILFMLAQVAFLKAQDVFGPRFFLPSGMSETQTYDYHPPLPTPDTEAPESSLGDCAICMDAILPIPVRHGHGHTPSAEEEKGLLSGVSSIHIHSSSSSGAGGGGGGGGSGSSGGMSGGVLAALWNVVNGSARERASGRGGWRKNYSLAPCHHLFHTECLERWLAIKNICPQCRRPLPPL